MHMNFDLSFLNSRKCRPVKSMPEFVSSSQRKAIQKLESLYTLSKLDVKALGIMVRTKPLIVAPSGSGKTYAVQKFAQSQKLDVLSINSGSWIPWGAKQENYTLTEVRNFVRQHGENGGVIFLDEIDKCQDHAAMPDNGWDRSVFTEILALLDCDNRLQTLGWEQTTLQVFRSGGFFVIGAGAWQHLKNEAARPAAGFGRLQIQDYRQDIRFGIPDEIAQRFSQEIIHIDYPNEQDYAEAIAGIHEAIGAPAPTRRIIQYHARKGGQSNRGVRFLEAYLTRLLADTPEIVQHLPRKKMEDCADKPPKMTEEVRRELLQRFGETLLQISKDAEELALRAELARHQLSRDPGCFLGEDTGTTWKGMGVFGAANELSTFSRELYISIAPANESQWSKVCEFVRDRLRMMLWSSPVGLKNAGLFELALKLKHGCDTCFALRAKVTLH